MFGVQHGHALPRKLFHELHQAGTLVLIQAGRRLIEQQELRSGRQRHGQFQPFLGTIRQAQRVLASQRVQAGLFKQRQRRFAPLRIQPFKCRNGLQPKPGLRRQLHIL